MSAAAETAPAYLVAVVHVTDAEAFERARRAASSATTERFGARFLARGSRVTAGGALVEVIEGAATPDHVTVIEYPSMAQARAWLASDEYRATRAQREGTAQFSLFLVPGLPRAA